MKRRMMAWIVGGAGALAAANAALSARAGRLDPPLAGERKTYRFRGMDVSYTEAGEGRDVLLLHGINAAATSYEWKPVFAALAEEYHVVAPDLPGFGLSDRPPIEYDADLYTRFVGDFAADVLPGAVCVASSLTGAYAVLGGRERTPFSKLVLVCPTATTTAMRRPWVRTLLRSPLIGTALFNALASKPSIRYFSADHGYYDPGRIPTDEVDYQWKSAHQEGARFAPASFVSGHLDPDGSLTAALSSRSVPATLVWGREADLTPLAYGRDLAEAADTKLVVFDRARLLPHVEHADEFVDVLRDELSGNG